MPDVQRVKADPGIPFFRPAQLKRKALSFAGDPSKNFFDFAQSLHRVHSISPVSLKDIVTATGMSLRRLYYLIDVGRMLDEYRLEKSEVEKIGWTKVGIIARHVAAEPGISRESLSDFLALAATTKARDLKGVLEGQPKSSAVRCVLLHLTPEDHDRLVEALVAHGAVKKGRGLIGKEEALMKIIDSEHSTS